MAGYRASGNAVFNPNGVVIFDTKSPERAERIANILNQEVPEWRPINPVGGSPLSVPSQRLVACRASRASL